MLAEFNNAMMAGTSPEVQIWMNWMGLVFMASIIFIWKYKPARAVLAALIATMVGAIIVWVTLKNVHLLGIIHLIVWLPLAIYLWKTVLSNPAKANLADSPSLYDRAFFIWAGLVFATIIISLVFDIRDIFLVLTGAK